MLTDSLILGFDATTVREQQMLKEPATLTRKQQEYKLNDSSLTERV